MEHDLIEAAWGLIANAYGGDWTQASEEWQGAAERWRIQWCNYLDQHPDRANQEVEID